MLTALVVEWLAGGACKLSVILKHVYAMMWTDVGSVSLPSSAVLLHELRQTVCQAFGVAWSCLHLYLQQCGLIVRLL